MELVKVLYNFVQVKYYWFVRVYYCGIFVKFLTLSTLFLSSVKWVILWDNIFGTLGRFQVQL